MLRDEGVAKAVEHMPCNCKALNSNPSTSKKYFLFFYLVSTCFIFNLFFSVLGIEPRTLCMLGKPDYILGFCLFCFFFFLIVLDWGLHSTCFFFSPSVRVSLFNPTHPRTHDPPASAALECCDYRGVSPYLA